MTDSVAKQFEDWFNSDAMRKQYMHLPLLAAEEFYQRGWRDAGACLSSPSVPDTHVIVPLLVAGDTPCKVAAFDAWYESIKHELPHNEDGSHSGAYWVALMQGINAYLAAAQPPSAPSKP